MMFSSSRFWGLIFMISLLLVTETNASGITPMQCSELRSAVAVYGSVAGQVGARLRGYTPAQIAYATRACHL